MKAWLTWNSHGDQVASNWDKSVPHSDTVLSGYFCDNSELVKNFECIKGVCDDAVFYLLFPLCKPFQHS